MTNKLNTTKIGDKFETQSLEIIKKVIEEEQLGHLTNHIKIFQKKEYYSNLRKKNIKFDLTIEVWPPEATRYVILYIIECKDYETRVPVSKIEDFHSKILQVAGVNVKGIFISNSPLQEGGFNIAESIGMMVIQGESSDDYKIILHKKTRQDSKNKIPFITETIEDSIKDIGVKHIEKLIDKKILNAFKTISNDSKISYGINRLSKDNIKIIVDHELNKINKRFLTDAHLISIKVLIDYLKNNYDIDFKYFESNSNILGFCNIKENTIKVNKTLQGTRRELFVIGHEFGHYLLHSKLTIGNTLYDLFEDSEYNFRTGKHDLVNPKHWIEWQANYFSTSLVLPKAQFLARVWKCQDSLNRSRGKIYLDDQYENVKDFSELVNKLSYLFNVSKTTIIYRLKEMEQINDQSRLKSIGQIISEYRNELFI